MGRSSTLRTGWQVWLTYASFVLASLLLLVFERAHVGLFLWDLANLSAQPGYIVVKGLQRQQKSTLEFVQWREKVVLRVAQLEQERMDQQLRQAELTQQIQLLQSAQQQQAAGMAGINFSLDTWQPAQWQGFTGAWQVSLGCQQGVVVGDPVTTNRGALVGEVQEVKASYSLVKSWDSLDWRVPVRVGTSSAVAVVASHPTGVEVFSLRWPAPVKNNDVIFTAGNQSIPRGLVVGELQELQAQEAFGEATAEVAVPVQILDLSTVYLPKRAEVTCQP